MSWFTALKAGLAAALIVAVYLGGDSNGANRVIARDAKANAQLAERIEAETRKLWGVADTLNKSEAQRRETMREIYVKVPQVIRAPAYANVCVDAAGVQLIDQATEAANGGDGGSVTTPTATPSAEARPQR